MSLSFVNIGHVGYINPTHFSLDSFICEISGKAQGARRKARVQVDFCYFDGGKTVTPPGAKSKRVGLTL